MKQQDVFKKIGIIIKELNEQYDYLGGTDNQLNDLELELFVANAHFLAEHSEVLRKLNAQNTPPPAPAPESEPLREEKYFEPVVQQVISPAEKPATEDKPITLPPDTPAPVIDAEITHEPVEDNSPVPHIDLAANGADDDFSFIRQQEPEIIKHELVLDESQNWEDEDDEGFKIDDIAETEEEVEEAAPVEVAEPKTVKEEPPAEVKKEVPKPVEAKKEEPAVEAKKETPVAETKKEAPVAETKKQPASEEPLTINQMISAQLNKSGSKVSEQLHGQPVDDLKQAITLNDKLLYIKDLFNGYNLAYSEAIDILNRYSSFEEADNFLKSNYAVKNQWSSKEATVDKFYALLRRRYQ